MTIVNIYILSWKGKVGAVFAEELPQFLFSVANARASALKRDSFIQEIIPPKGAHIKYQVTQAKFYDFL